MTVFTSDTLSAGKPPCRAFALGARVALAAAVLVHAEIGQAIGFLILFAPHVLVGDVSNRGGEPAGVLMKGNQALVLDAVITDHLLHDQL